MKNNIYQVLQMDDMYQAFQEHPEEHVAALTFCSPVYTICYQGILSECKVFIKLKTKNCAENKK